MVSAIGLTTNGYQAILTWCYANIEHVSLSMGAFGMDTTSRLPKWRAPNAVGFPVPIENSGWPKSGETRSETKKNNGFLLTWGGIA